MATATATPDGIAPGMFVASLISAVLGTLLPGPGTLYRTPDARLPRPRPCRRGTGRAASKSLAKTATGEVDLDTEVRRLADDALIVSGEAEVHGAPHQVRRDDIEVPGLIVQRHRHFEALLERARPLPALITAVVCPEEANSLGGAVLAARESIITPILIGDPDRIAAAAAGTGGRSLRLRDHRRRRRRSGSAAWPAGWCTRAGRRP